MVKFCLRVLCNIYNSTLGSTSSENVVLRAKIMNELKKLDPQRYREWLDSPERSPSKFFEKGDIRH